MRHLTVLAAVVLLAGCAATQKPIDKRGTQGPTALQMWTYRMINENGREPTFDEEARWKGQMDTTISKYLAEHPEDANSLDVSTFKWERQVAVGMTKEQTLILLGPPEGTTTDQAEMEKLARRFWPFMKGNVTEAWVYPLGWRIYFIGQRVADVTQYLSPKE